MTTIATTILLIIGFFAVIGVLGETLHWWDTRKFNKAVPNPKIRTYEEIDANRETTTKYYRYMNQPLCYAGIDSGMPGYRDYVIYVKREKDNSEAIIKYDAETLGISVNEFKKHLKFEEVEGFRVALYSLSSKSPLYEPLITLKKNEQNIYETRRKEEHEKARITTCK